SIARGLRLGAGQPAAMITVRFDNEASGRAVALTVAALRADMFRIVVDWPADSAPVRNITAGHALPDELAIAPDEDDGFAPDVQAAVRWPPAPESPPTRQRLLPRIMVADGGCFAAYHPIQRNPNRG